MLELFGSHQLVNVCVCLHVHACTCMCAPVPRVSVEHSLAWKNHVHLKVVLVL